MGRQLKFFTPAPLLIFAIGLLPSTAWAGPCCGGSPSTSALIMGDDRSILNLNFMHSEVVVDSVDSAGIWRKRNEKNITQTLLFDSAYVFADQWQIGASVPVVRQQFQNSDQVSLGDSQFLLGYEFLPEREFHLYRPKGMAYLKLTTPTGTPPWEDSESHMVSSGRGYWSIGLGTLLLKNWEEWDVLGAIELSHGLKQNISSAGFNGQIRPGTTSTIGIGAGYSQKNWRLGGQIFWIYEEATESKAQDQQWQNGHFSRYAEGQLNLTYFAKDEWSGTVGFRDQSLFGSPIQTSLERGITLQLQKRWPR